jgi:hypothetical protein
MEARTKARIEVVATAKDGREVLEKFEKLMLMDFQWSS